MKSIVVYYFSGTGNTEKIVRLFEEEVEKHQINVSLISMEKALKSPETIHSQQFDIIGLAYPIYGFGTPHLVDDFCRLLPPEVGKNVFIFKTGADFISINHNASHLLIKELEQKGYTVYYDRIIVMPSNWIVSYNNAMIKQLYVSARNKVKHMAGEVLEFKVRRYKTGKALKALSLGISHLEKNYGSKYFGQSLRTNEDCNLCGICIKNCPRLNIQNIQGTLEFGNRCIWCMRCIYNCPQKAIVSKGMNFCILKEGYNLKSILESDNGEKAFLTVDTKGFFKHLYTYISDKSL